MLNVPSIAGGADGVTVSRLANRNLGLGLALALLLLAYLVAERIGNGPLGRFLRVIREDEALAATLGRNPMAYRSKVTALSWVMAAAAGILFARIVGDVAPTSFLVTDTFLVWTAVILGGPGRNIGVVIGAAALILLSVSTRFLAHWSGLRPDLVANLRLAVFGLALVLMFLSARKACSPSYGRRATLTVTDVSLTFGGFQALRGVSLRLGGSEIVGLVGPNGSGKSTLLNVIAGVYAPGTGSVELDGRALPFGRIEHVAERGVGRTFQISRLAQRLTVFDNMMAGANCQPGERLFDLFLRPRAVAAAEAANAAKATAILKRLDLLHKANGIAGALSGGQQKLLTMGVLLMAEPKALLLDEPAAGVNPVLIDQQVGFLKSLATRAGRSSSSSTTWR